MTGGASGIGEAVVGVLAERGISTLIVDRDPTGAERVGRQTGQPFVVADVSSPSDWNRVVTTAPDSPPFGYGVLGAGVNGGDDGADINSLSHERIASIVNVNLTGVVLGVRAMAQELAQSGGGSIVVVSSGAGLEPFPPDPVYSAAKTGAVTFVRAIASALADDGVVLSAVCPVVPVDTPMLTPAVRARIAANGHALMPPEVVAGAIVQALIDAQPGEVFAVGHDGVVPV